MAVTEACNARSIKAVWKVQETYRRQRQSWALLVPSGFSYLPLNFDNLGVFEA